MHPEFPDFLACHKIAKARVALCFPVSLVDDCPRWAVFIGGDITVASFIKEVNWWLAKRALKTNGRLANRQLNYLVKEATVHMAMT